MADYYSEVIRSVNEPYVAFFGHVHTLWGYSIQVIADGTTATAGIDYTIDVIYEVPYNLTLVEGPNGPFTFLTDVEIGYKLTILADGIPESIETLEILVTDSFPNETLGPDGLYYWGGGYDTQYNTLIFEILDGELENLPPVAADDFLSGFVTTKDEPFTTGSVLENDTDPEGDYLSIESFSTSGTKGLVSFLSDGKFHYDPNGAFSELGPGDFALDSFTYTVSDGYLSNTATVTITVTGASCEDLHEQLTDLQTREEIAAINIQGLQEQIGYLDEALGWATVAGVWATLPAAAGFPIGAIGGVVGAVGGLGLISIDVYYAEGWNDLIISTAEQIENITDAMAEDILSGSVSGGTRKLLGGMMKTIGKVGGELGTIFDLVEVSDLAEGFQFRKDALSTELSSWVDELTFIQEDIEEVEGFLANCHDEVSALAGLLDSAVHADHFDFAPL